MNASEQQPAEEPRPESGAPSAEDTQSQADFAGEQAAAEGERQPGLFEMLGRRIDEIPQVQMAESMVFQAQDGIHSATQRVEQSRAAFQQRVDDIRQATPADVVNVALKFVSRHPGKGVLAAAAMGFLLGRALRK